MDDAVQVLGALLEHLNELPALVGADWDHVRPSLLADVEAWLLGDSDPAQLAGNVLFTLRRYPEALARVRAARSLRSPANLEGLRSVPSVVYSFATPGGLESMTVPERALAEHVAERLRDGLADPAAVYLNAWFHERAEGAPLREGKAAPLRVNLGPKRAGGAAAAVTEARRFDEVDHVDVVVRCATARVEPSSRRLAMPPSAERFVEFALTPLRAGALRVAVVVLVQNDPVERLEFDDEVAP
jgi:hypothetical protein